jgi:hypothetical protein
LGDWKQWSEWLKEGYYISYVREGVRYYEHIIARDLAHYELDWFETIPAGGESGPHIYDELEITKGYDEESNTNNIWQLIFGIKGQAYIYIELPTDTHRHGIPKVPKPSANMREVSHFEEWMSPFYEPSFITEHFMMRPDLYNINWSAYNPEDVAITDLRLNLFIAKMLTERIGTETEGVLSTPSTRSSERTEKLKAKWSETLDKLSKRVIPHRPLTLMPVRAPAAVQG